MSRKPRPNGDSLTETIAERLVRYRKQRGLTQAQLASLLGIAQPNISSYERGEARPSFDILVQMTQILKVSADQLLGIQTRPHEPQPAMTDRRLIQQLALIDKLPKRDKDALLRTIRLYTDRVKRTEQRREINS